jgi:hypothetical protein
LDIISILTSMRGAEVSEYKEGFEDGVTFTREVIINNLRQWAETHEDGETLDWVADQIEFGKLDNDA